MLTIINKAVNTFGLRQVEKSAGKASLISITV